MLTVELLKPARLNKYGRIWERGVEVPVELAEARVLHKDGRFQINGLFEALDAAALAPEAEPVADKTAAAEGGRPSDTAILYAAIREAADQLDVDVEDKFTDAGKPQVDALEKLLGYAITADEIDQAMGVKGGKPEAAKQGGVTIRRKAAEAKEEAKDASTDGAVTV
jgi:hypothetical protein